MPKALVVGALGVVGRANVEYLTTLPDWSAVALSRRARDFDTRAQFISCDATDRSASLGACGPWLGCQISNFAKLLFRMRQIA